MGRQNVLDFLRADVLARADDDVLLPSGDDDVALVHATPEIAHAEVAVRVEGAGVVIGMQIPDELLRPADENLALLAVGNVHIVRIDDAHLSGPNDFAI